jgi:hypothetical protein
MTSDKQPHILSASSSLLGICFVLITGLKLTQAYLATYADEISIVASLCFIASCLLSYLSMRQDRTGKLERFADYFFLIGLLFLSAAVLLFATGVL